MRLCEELCTGKRPVYTHCRGITGTWPGASRRVSDASSVASPITASNCFIRSFSDSACERARGNGAAVPPGDCVRVAMGTPSLHHKRKGAIE
jgi:hypothetical protein